MRTGEAAKANQGWSAAIPAILEHLIQMNRADDRFFDCLNRWLMDRKKAGIAETDGMGPDEFAD